MVERSLAGLASLSWESPMRRIEAVITPRTLDTFKEAAPRLGIATFDLVDVYRSGCATIERGQRLYKGREFTAALLPCLRVEFVLFNDDVHATVHQLLQPAHPESISVFRLDQEVRTLARTHGHLNTLFHQIKESARRMRRGDRKSSVLFQKKRASTTPK